MTKGAFMEPRAARPADAPDRGELDLVERLCNAVGMALKGKPETIRLVETLAPVRARVE
jgi:hypothetical protein